MDNNSIKQSYFLGVILGICLSILTVLLLYKTGSISLESSDSEINEIVIENENLRKELSEKDLKLSDISKKEVNVETKKDDKQDIKIILDIKQDMSNSQIADLLVKNGVYKHKNDLMMLLEMLRFDRREYGRLLEEKGYISSSYEFNNALNQLDVNQYASAEYLFSKKKVQDRSSFMKIVYLLSVNRTIKYGSKEFTRDCSLREVGDVLLK